MARHSGKYVSYLRVSTAKQGASGLGLEAQRAAVEVWLNGGHWEVVEEVDRDRERQEPSQPAGAGEGARCLPPLRREADHLAARSAVARSGVSAEPARCRHRLRCGRHAECKPHDRRHHGAGRRTGARGDQPAHQGRAGGRKGAWRASRQSPAREAARFHDRKAATAAGLKGGAGAALAPTSSPN